MSHRTLAVSIGVLAEGDFQTQATFGGGVGILGGTAVYGMIIFEATITAARAFLCRFKQG